MTTSEMHNEILVAPGKAMRLADMIDTMVRELHAAPIDDAARIRLLSAYRSVLVEVGSTLSDALLDELARLQTASLDPSCSIDEARVAMAQLEGWLHGLIEAMVTGVLAVNVADSVADDSGTDTEP